MFQGLSGNSGNSRGVDSGSSCTSESLRSDLKINRTLSSGFLLVQCKEPGYRFEDQTDVASMYCWNGQWAQVQRCVWKGQMLSTTTLASIVKPQSLCDNPPVIANAQPLYQGLPAGAVQQSVSYFCLE